VPLTRPAEISDGVSLSDKLGRSDFAFVSEDGAVDALLPAIVDEFSPDKHGISVACSKNNVFSWSDELKALSSVLVVIAAVVPFVEGETTLVSVFGDVPVRRAVVHL